MIETTSSETFPLNLEEDVVRVRQAVRRVARALGFSLVNETKLVTAASEIARNTIIYGGGGTLQLERLQNHRRVGVRLLFLDEGPGIPDVALALRDGYTTGQGLGLGLGGAKRLVDEFTIDSQAGAGTRVILVSWSG